MKKKYIITLLTLGFILLITAIILLVFKIPVSAPQYANDLPLSVPIVSPPVTPQSSIIYKEIENTQFGYKLKYNQNYSVRNQSSDAFVHSLGGYFVSVLQAPTKGYQLPGVDITVLDRSIMGNLSLSEWVESVSADTHEILQENTNQYKYTAANYKTISTDKIIFVANNEPFVNGSAVLLFDNGTNLIQLSGAFDNDLFFELAKDFQVKFDNQYLGLTSSDITSIKSFYKDNIHF
ncbi:MAG: hypothetical protein ABIM99_01280 [Candidatus Dojkabacteria bacterium]